MATIGYLKNVDPKIGQQDFIFEDGSFFLGTFSDTSSWREISLEQVFKLDAMKALYWNNENHRQQILDHYRRSAGLPIAAEAVAAVSVKEPSFLRQFFTSLFTNRFVRMALLLVLSIFLILGAVQLFGIISYSDSVGTGDAGTLLNKYQKAATDSVNELNVFTQMHDLTNNKTIYSADLYHTMGDITSNYDGVLDMDSLFAAAVSQLGSDTASVSVATSATAEYKEISAGRSEAGLGGSRRMLAYVLFSNRSFYSDPELTKYSQLVQVLSTISGNVKSMESVYNKSIDLSYLKSVDTKSGLFSYPVPLSGTDSLAKTSVIMKFKVSKTRALGPRFAAISFENQSAASGGK